MPEPSQGSLASELDRRVGRWRRAFQAVHLILTLAISAWALVSVALYHAGFPLEQVRARGAQISARADRPAELRRCQRDLAALLTGLHRETYGLQARALRLRIDLEAEWGQWSRLWLEQWKEIDRRCRLSELGGSGVSRPLDEMKAVHERLRSLQLASEELVKRFSGPYVQRLREVQRKLLEVQQMIEREAARRVRQETGANAA